MTQYFAIVFVGRVGSSFLEGLLDSHPDAQCLGEIIVPNMATPHEPLDTFREVLDQSVHLSGFVASGFKLPLFTIQRRRDILDLLAAKSYKVIHITRRNKLDQYLSMRLAQVNNAWRSDYGAYVMPSIGVNPWRAAKVMKRFKFFDEQIRRLVSGFPYLHVEYEDILATRDFSGILSFLGLQNRPLTCRYERQRAIPRQQAISNFADLERRYAGTPFESFLSD
jgi:hypothetical protein